MLVKEYNARRSSSIYKDVKKSTALKSHVNVYF